MKLRLPLALAAALITCCANPAFIGHASELTWNQAASGTWSDGTGSATNSWSGAADGNFHNGDSVSFVDLASSPDEITITIDGTVTPSSVIVNTDKTFTFASANSGVMSGTGSFTKQGTGTVTLGSNYALTGAFTLAGGNLTLSGAATLYDFSGSAGTMVNMGTHKLTVNVTQNVTYAGNLSIAAGAIEITGAGVFHFTGSRDATGSSGKVVVDGATLDLTGGGRLFTNSSLQHNGYLTVKNGGTLILDKAMQSSGQNLGQLWARATAVLIENSTLKITGKNVGGNAVGRGFGFSGNATFEVVNEGDTFINTNNNINSRMGVAANTDLTLTGKGEGQLNVSPISETTALDFGNYNEDNTTGHADTLRIIKNGTGTWMLGGTYGSQIGRGIDVQEGVLQVGIGVERGDTGAADISIQSAGTLRYFRTGALEISKVISGNGNLIFDGGASYTLTGANTFSGNTTVGNNTMLTLDFTGKAANTSLLGNSQLTLAGGNLIVKGSDQIQLQTLNGLVLANDTSSTLTLEAGTATLELSVGAITGSGKLLVNSPATTIVRTITGADEGAFSNILFTDGTGLLRTAYDSATGILSAGTAIDELKATGNIATETYVHTVDRTFTTDETVDFLYVMPGSNSGITLNLGGKNFKVNGAVEYTSANPWTITGTGTAEFHNLVNKGSITLNAQLSVGMTDGMLTSTGGAWVLQNSGKLILTGSEDHTMDSQVSGAGTIRMEGEGTLSLGVANAGFTGKLELAGGTTSFVTGALGTAVIAFQENGGRLQWAAGNSQDISGLLNSATGTHYQLDTNGNTTVTLATTLANPTHISKYGQGTLYVQKGFAKKSTLHVYEGYLRVGFEGGSESQRTLILQSDYIVEQGAVIWVAGSLGGPSHSGVGSLLLKGGTMQVDNFGNHYFGGRTITFDVAPGKITLQGTGNGGWRLEGEANKNVTITVKAAASGSTITDGLITITRGNTNSPVIFNVEKGSNFDDINGDLFISSRIAKQSSTEAVLKQGNGKLVFTNSSAADMAITVAGGVFQVGNGGTTGEWAGNVILNGASSSDTPAYIVNRSDAVTLGRIVSGTGDVGYTGGGTFTVTAANTYRGALSVGDNTTVLLGNAEALGIATGLSLGDGALLSSVDGNGFSIGGKVSFAGDAVLGNTGTGSFAFTGNEVTMGGGKVALGVDTIFNANTITGSGTFSIADGINFTTSALTANTGGTGTLGLEMGADSKLTFAKASVAPQYLSGIALNGNATIDFTNQTQVILNIGSQITGSGMITLDNYNYNGTYNYVHYNNGLGAWALLSDIKIQTSSGLQQAMLNASGQVVLYDPAPATGDLVVNDVAYDYTRDKKYYGSMAEDNVLVFTHQFTFASGADPTYGFTLRNDAVTGTPATSFTVDSLLTNGPSNLVRGVHVWGQAGSEDRRVTLGNTGNSFTGDVLVESAVLRAVIDDTGSAVNQANITTLGVNNTVKLTTNATLVLDSEHKYDGSASGYTGDFTYANNIQLGQNGTTVRQDSGSHTLSGNIILIGSGAKVIENAVSDTTLTLSGSITGGTGTSGLTLKTAASPDSKIALDLSNDSSVVQSLSIEGNVDLTSGTLTSAGDVVIDTAGTLGLAGGTLVVNGLTGPGILALDDGGVLKAGRSLSLGGGLTIDGSRLGDGETMTLHTNGHTMTIDAAIENLASGATLAKTGAGELILNQSVTGTGTLSALAGTTTLNGAGNNFGGIQIAEGAAVNVNGTTGLNSNMNVLGTLGGNGSVTVGEINFGSTGKYTGTMSDQTWDATFADGSTFAGKLDSRGTLVFENGSHFVGSTSLDTSQDPAQPNYDPQIQMTNGGTVTLNGVKVSGDTTTDQGFWQQGEEYTFTLIQTESGNLFGRDGDVLGERNFANSVTLDPTSWGAFLTGTLGYVEGEQLTVTVTRNARHLSDFARTYNQKAVAGGIDHAMDTYKERNLADTELGDVIRYFNAMGNDIGSTAGPVLDMIGGLSSYQTLAGQRTDLLRHVEAVRQRAQSGGKGVNILKEYPENQFWVEATQSYQQNDATLNSPGYKVQTWGGAIGVDFLSAANYSLGASFAYSSVDVTSDEYSAKSMGDALYVDLYGRFESGRWSGTFVVSGGTTDFDVKRTVVLGDRQYNVKGSPSGKQVLGMAEIAYAQPLTEDGLYLEPHVGMAVGQSQLDGYTESGFGNAGLEVSEQKMNILQGTLGVRLFRQNIDSYLEYETSRWELRAALIQEMGDKEYRTTSRFIGAPRDFQTKGNKVGATGFLLGGGFSKSFDESWSVFGDVNAEFRNAVKGMNATLGLRCTF